MSAQSGSGRLLRMSYLVASVAGAGFFAMSVALLGIWPGEVLERDTLAMSPDNPLELNLSEERGRAIYSREGCAYCHTQQVRYTAADMKRFGAPTLAWETRFDYPHLWGTRRIGPDLARETGAHSTDWHFAHLFAPRDVVSESIMPAYPWLFDGAANRPRQEARDLVAYLDSLGRAREIAGPEGEAHAREACNCADDEMAMMAFHAGQLNANPARAQRDLIPPALPEGNLDRGRELFTRNCASCHGPQGQPNLRIALSPRPINLAEHDYRRDYLARVLWAGVQGTAMPAWRDRSPQDLADLVAAVQSLHTPATEPDIPTATRELGARVYADNCAQCHGDTGAGDGWAVKELRVVPASFEGARPSLAESLRVLRTGVEGTQMGPWTDRLNDEALASVAAYVRTLFKPDSQGGNP